MKDLVIFGASGFGREVAWLAERINNVTPTWNILGFIDDDENIQGKNINGYCVLGKTADSLKYRDAYFVVAVGASKTRKKIVDNLRHANPDIKFGILIDPTVEMSQFVTIGEGSIICAHTIITVNVSIESHVIINLDCTVGHDAVIKDFATLYPSVNVSGAVNIGYDTEIGTGTQIIQGKSVGDDCIVGAGAVVTKDIEEVGTYVGVPAGKLNRTP